MISLDVQTSVLIISRAAIAGRSMSCLVSNLQACSVCGLVVSFNLWFPVSCDLWFVVPVLHTVANMKSE